QGKKKQHCSTKSRNQVASTPRPGIHGSPSGQRDELTSTDPATALATETFKKELLSSLRGDIGDAIKSEIKGVFEEEMAGIRADINMVRTERQAYQSSIAAELTTLKNTTGEMEKSLSSCTDDVVTLQREVAWLKTQSGALQDKCEDLEGRSRRNNIRIVGVPESQGSTTAVVSALLQQALGLPEPPVIDRSHRSLQPQPRRGDQPRVIVARLHYFQDCANILRLAREKQRIKVNGANIFIYPDYTARVAKARAGYNGVRQQLRELEGVRYGILYPARLRITHGNKDHIFSTPEEAQAYVTQNFPAHGASAKKK
uniref:L1 transposable element RRM domain-containing protein n=1 Tax=Salarias fasciatus TaxID=181472 RepID=A0A672GGL5_SALFA